MKEVTKYMAEDGKVFDSKTECEEYEETLGTEYELTFKVNAILRLDGIVFKRKIRTNAEPNFDYGSDFRDIVFDAIMDTDVSESAGELLGIAANQGIYPYFDCFENEGLTEYKKI
jgi:hypothetical protein